MHKKAPLQTCVSCAYHYDTVLWTVENGIIAGVGNNKFGPNEPCTRAQVMTFLWKADQIAPPAPAPEPTETPVTQPEAHEHQWVIKNLAEHAYDMVSRGEEERYWNNYYTATETNARICPQCGEFDESSCVNQYQGKAGSEKCWNW